jgi:leucyl-tRNA synthetase
MGEDGRKMSKRFGNVVNPDEIVVRFGADTLRVYEMFMGPFDQQIAWSTDSMVGARRFIEKVWKLLSKVIDASESVFSVSSNSLTKTLHKTIKKVTEDIQGLKFNTAISSLMIAVNEMEKTESISRTQFELLLKILAPFAPHITEELWSELGNKKSIHISEWPIYDPKLIQDDDVRIIVQINGKMRGSFNASKDTSQQSLENTAKALPEIQKWLDGKTIKKVVVVPNRLVSIVVS